MHYIKLNLKHLLGFKIDLPMPKIGHKGGDHDHDDDKPDPK